MKYEIIQPCVQLKDFIRHFWVAPWDVNTQLTNNKHLIIASSLTEITFAFKDNRKNSALLFTSVQGHTFEPNQYAVDGYYHLLGVSLYSQAIPFLFHLPSTELNIEYLSLDTFLGAEGNTLNEKIALASSTAHRIRILSDFFINRLSEKRTDDRIIINAIKEIKSKNGDVKIIDLADQFCLSQKQFNRKFRHYMGFNPKMYSRIIRFESVIKNYPTSPSLTHLAHSNNYHDQAHFTHELKSFTGMKPKDFWKLSDGVN